MGIELHSHDASHMKSTLQCTVCNHSVHAAQLKQRAYSTAQRASTCCQYALWACAATANLQAAAMLPCLRNPFIVLPMTLLIFVLSACANGAYNSNCS